jgi:protein unc-119
MSGITPDDVSTLSRPTSGFLCSLNDNKYNIDFLQFTISDYDTKNILFEVGKDSPPPQDMTLDFSTPGEDMYRKIKYTFSEDVLRLPFIQTS